MVSSFEAKGGAIMCVEPTLCCHDTHTLAVIMTAPSAAAHSAARWMPISLLAVWVGGWVY